MLFKSSNHEEISRYYRGTFVKFHEFGDQLFSIMHVNSEGVTGQLASGDDFILHLNDDVPYEVDYLLPHKSFFQNGKAAVLLQRVPARQYRRGVCSDNTRMTELTTGGQTKNIAVNFSTLGAFVSKATFPTMSEALANKKRMRSVALSPRVAYVPDNCTFYIDLKAVGVYVNDHVECFNKLFVPEIAKVAASSHIKVV